MSPALTLRQLAGFGLALLFAFDALAAVGTVQFSVGDVRLRDASGRVRAMQKGEAINEGDTILTGSSGTAQLKMSDGGILAVRAETELKIDTYRFTGKEDGTENALMSLVKGGFRTITGIIGRTNKNNYRVNTGTATIGIRGTDHEPFVILAPTAGAPQPPAAPGTYDKVNVGEAFISSPLGTVFVSQNQVGFAAPNLAPTILPVVPEFFRATPPIQAGAPATGTAATTGTTEVRDTAVVDTTATVTAPTTTITTTTTTTTTTTSPTTTTITQTVSGESTTGVTTNLTTQTATTSTGSSVPVSEFTATSNPAVASSNYMHGVLSQKPVTGGAEITFIESERPQANTKYVLDQNKDLIEILNSSYFRFGLTSIGPSIADANVKFLGGAAKDHYEAADGTLYMGRWQGGQIDVTDLATSGAQAPFSDALGLTSAHWAVWLSPANSALSSTLAPINNVQTLLGTRSYALTAATHPTDSSGNVGTLNSASLTANFTSQTVDTSIGLSFSTSDPVNVSSRNLTIAGSATGIPITQDNFGGVFSTSCTGTGCGSNPYLGLFSGAFGASASGGTTTGAVGTGAVLGYRFLAFPASTTSNQPFPDAIDGAAAFTTASAPTPGVTPTPVCSTCAFRSSVFYPIDGSPGFTFFASSGVPTLGETSTIPGANYLFDSSGNLVRVLVSSWNAFERATGSQCSVTGGAPCLTSPGPTATASTMTTMTGGTVGTGGATFSSSTVISSTSATERYSDATGIRLGRYEGGSVIVQDLETGETLETTLTGTSGPRSVLWAVREQPASIPVTGRFDYRPTFATKPTDSFGSTDGILRSAQLTANFSDMTVQPQVRVSINGQGLSATASGVPIQSGSFGFNVSSATAATTNPSFPVFLQVGCAGANCAPAPDAGGRPYGARVIGGFGGNGTADGAFFRYTFNTRFDPNNPTDVATAASLSRPINDYINGLVAFSKGSEVAPATSPGAEIVTSYFSGTFNTTDFSSVRHYSASATSFSLTNGSLASVSEDPATSTGSPSSESISGGTAVLSGTVLDSAALARTGISFGRYDAQGASGSGTAATLTGVDDAGTYSRNILGSYHWYKGPEATPFFPTIALTGTAQYTLVGYTPPTDQNRVQGTVNSASLSVNFSNQSASFDLNLTVPAAGSSGVRNWLASASNVRLGDLSPHFNASTNSDSGSAGVFPVPLHNSLSVTLNGSNAFGSVDGSLTGPGVNGAGLGYAFFGNDPNNSFVHEHVNGTAAFALSSFSGLGQTAATSVPMDNVWYRLGIVATGPLAAGAVDSEFNAHVMPNIVAVPRTSLDTNGFVTRADSLLPVVVSPPTSCTTCTPRVDQVPVIVSILSGDVAAVASALSLPTPTAAQLVNTGIDAGTGIRWGRYAGGAIAVFDRVTGLALGFIDTSTQNIHTIFTAPQNGPTVLPISGTANYVLVGNTNPTDNFGNVGTLGSATLNANFTAKTVDAAVNLTMPGSTWSASATGMPIIKDSAFFAQKDLGGATTPVPLTVTSSLGTNTSGRLIGGFTGTSGQGAALGYALNVNGNAGTTVSGVAAFRRP